MVTAVVPSNTYDIDLLYVSFGEQSEQFLKW